MNVLYDTLLDFSTTHNPLRYKEDHIIIELIQKDVSYFIEFNLIHNLSPLFYALLVSDDKLKGKGNYSSSSFYKKKTQEANTVLLRKQGGHK